MRRVNSSNGAANGNSAAEGPSTSGKKHGDHMTLAGVPGLWQPSQSLLAYLMSAKRIGSSNVARLKSLALAAVWL